MSSKVVTRFPPSPTGYFHIGSARTALFNYLFAKKHGGIMYLRFEDTDKERSKKEYEEDILEGSHWLGIEYALPQVFRQSERTAIYQKYFKSLLKKGLAYEAEPQEKNPDKKVVRFKNPNVTIVFADLIRGDVTFNTTELGDFIIGRNVDEPLYHLAVVIDDYEMGVTHVIRGEDHISNTQRQILILEALGFPRPEYAHIPLILAKDRSKLSKRHGAVSVNEFKRMGYVPEAFVNYLAFLGWHPGTDEELFTKEKLIERFSLDQVQKSGAIFDEAKLRWFNREYISRMAHAEFKKYAEEFLSKETTQMLTEKKLFDAVIPLMQERIQTFGELTDMDEKGEYAYFGKEPSYDPEKLIPKNATKEATKAHLEAILSILEGVSEGKWHDIHIKEILWPYAEEKGKGVVLWPFRFALSGREKSPDPFQVAGIIGKDETKKRIRRAIEFLA